MGYGLGFKIWMQIDQSDLTEYIYFLSSNIIDKSVLIQKPSAHVPKGLNLHEIAEKAIHYFKYKCFNIDNGKVLWI